MDSVPKREFGNEEKRADTLVRQPISVATHPALRAPLPRGDFLFIELEGDGVGEVEAPSPRRIP